MGNAYGQGCRSGAARVCVALLSTIALNGCGTSLTTTTSYPNQLIGSAGQTFTVADLESISSDPDLDDDGKRAAFRALGIEDEELIDALLDL